MKKPLILAAFLGATPTLALAQALSDLPAAAAPGTCFVEIIRDEQVEWVKQRVVDQPASVEVELHPAVYEMVAEKHLVKDGTTEFKTVPATYKTEFETIDVRPGTSVTVAKQVVVAPARIIEEEIPPAYQTIMVEQLVTPAREERIETPATYITIEKPVVTGGTSEWHQLMCDDTPGSKIAEVQAALSQAGYPVVVDGIFGPETYGAMEAYQKAQGLVVGYLTVATVEHLGVLPN